MPHQSDARAPWIRWLACVTGSEMLLALATWIAPAVAMSPLLAFVLAFVCVAATALLTSAQTPVITPRVLWLVFPLVAPLLWLVAKPTSALHPYIVTACLLGAGTLLGAFIGARVQAAGHLIFVAIVSSAADIFSVYAPSGPTAALLSEPQQLSLLALPWPMLGTRDVVPLLGVGDVVFAALYFAAARAHRLSMTRTWIALAFGLTLALMLLLWFQQPLPALPMLGFAFVVAHPQARRVPPAERKRAWISVSVLLLVLGWIATYRH